MNEDVPKIQQSERKIDLDMMDENADDNHGNKNSATAILRRP
jgi:hypothetical protein